MTAVAVIFALLLGGFIGYMAAGARHAAYMAEGWAFLGRIASRREIDAQDVADAFGEPRNII